MKLVIATPLYPPEIGGPATYVKLLESSLPKESIEVEVVKFSDVRRLPKLIRHYVYFKRVLRAARTADLVLALDPVSVGLPAMWAASKAGKPFAVKIVGDYAWEQGRQRFGVALELDEFIHTRQRSSLVRLLQRIQTWVAKSAAQVIVPSTYLKSIVGAWGVSEEKGIIPAEIAALPRPLVVAVGRLVPWKNIDGVIDALANTNTSLVIVGDGPLRASLTEHARRTLSGRHAFVGALSHADTLAVLAIADVFVLNSSYEGLSHVLIEALALGTPTIATAVGGNPEVVTDGETGILVASDNPTRLAEALASLLANAPLRTRLGVNAKISAKRFSVKTMLEQTAACLSSLT